MRLLDLFCGAGGASMGYHRAGFEIVGVDIKPQKHYPFAFIKADALTLPVEFLREFDAIHASPPCQKYSIMNNIHKKEDSHPDLVNSTRDLLGDSGTFYIIENVYKSPLKTHFMLCGTIFGLKIIRHRYFECNFPPPLLTMSCNHLIVYDPWHGDNRTAEKFREAMGITWMPLGGGGHTDGSINNAIPPAYTEFIGKQLMRYLVRKNEQSDSD